MTLFKAFLLTAALCCIWAGAFGQPSSIEPILPPIPNPPYEHTVRFCGIANNETFNLNSSSITDKCDWKRYANSFVQFVAAPIALGCAAVAIAIILPFILCCKCCAHSPVGGFVRLLLVAAFGALLVAGFILIYVGNGKTTTTVNDLSTTISTTIATAQTRLSEAKALASQLPYSNSSSEMQTFDDVAATLTSFQTDTKSVSDKVSKYDTYRKAALFVGSLVPLAMIIGAGLIALFNLFKPLMAILAWLLVFLSVVVWICMIVHLVIGKALSDICWEVDLAEAQGNSGALAILVKCRTNETPLQDVRNLVTSAINNATTQACNATEETCYVPNGGPVNCTLPSWTCNETALPDWLEFNMTDVALECNNGGGSTVYADPSDGCPSGYSPVTVLTQVLLVKNCPSTCRNPRFIDAATQGIDGINTLLQYYTLRDELLPLLTCDFVADAFFSAKASICKTFENALTLIFAGAALEAVGMGLAMAALTHVFLGHYGKKDIINPRDTL